MAINTFELKLVSTEQITPNVLHLRFVRADNEPLAFIPGQFINILFPGQEKRQQRSYSIASIPGRSDLIEIAISYVEGGLASEALKKLAPGDTIPASGPVGRLILKPEETPKRYVLVGTGTGIAPYRTMLPTLQERLRDNPDFSVEILLGVRDKTELLYAQDFLEWLTPHDNARFRACYSREIAQNCAPWECGGRVTHFLRELELNPEHDLIYLCGNPAMIDDAYELLQERGFDHKNVRREKYVFSH